MRNDDRSLMETDEKAVSSSGKMLGLQLIGIGAIALLASGFIYFAATIGLAAVGLYRWFVKKRPLEGALFLAVGLIMTLGIFFHVLWILNNMFKFTGIVLIIIGMFMLFKPSRS